MFKRVLTTAPYTIVLLGLIAASSAVYAIEVNSVGASRTIECRGQRVEVNGSGNNLTLLGECPTVQVNGMNQEVKIEIAGSIEVNGMGNKVIWGQALHGNRPNIQKSGVNNSVSQGSVGTGRSKQKSGDAGQAVGVSAEDRGGRQKVTIGGLNIETGGGSASVSSEGADVITINDNELTETVECDGKDVTVNGNENTLRLRGACGTVRVAGNENTLRIDAAKKISVLGNENSVVWQKGVGSKDPVVSDLGNENVIKQAE